MKNMKNNLTRIFSKIPKILTIIIIIVALLMPNIVMAISLDEEGSIKVNQKENIKIGRNNPTNISRDNVDLYLFLGNSKTYYNNMPFMFQNFMNDLGKSVIVKDASIAGHTLSDLWNNVNIRKELNNEYDYVVLQPKLLSSDSGEKEGAISIVNALKNKNPNIKVIINGIWKSKDEYKLNKKAQKIMNTRFRELQAAITSQCGVDTKISYWGQAAIRAYNKNSISEDALFVDDRHPTALNSYLGVASLYSTIYGAEANSNYNGKVDNSDFESIGEYNLNSWNYQIDRDRWPKDTSGIGQTQLMQNIAYKTYVAQKENPEEEEGEDENSANETDSDLTSEQTDLASLAERLSQITSSDQTNSESTGLTSEQLSNIRNRINQATENCQSEINDILFSTRGSDSNDGGNTSGQSDISNRINQVTETYQSQLSDILSSSDGTNLANIIDRINQATSSYQSELNNIQSTSRGGGSESGGASSNQIENIQFSTHGADSNENQIENIQTSQGGSNDEEFSSRSHDVAERLNETTTAYSSEIEGIIDIVNDTPNLSVDNSPRISIKNDENSGNVRVNITDYTGLNPDSIKLYTADGKEIDSKYYTIEAVTDENNKTTKLTYVLKEKFFNGKSKQISVVAKDSNGNYNKSSFNLKPKNDDKNNYSVDAAPRIKEFAIKSSKKVTFKVYDNAGISYLKVYDLNQKNKKGKYLLVKQVTNIKGSKKGTKITLKLKDLESADSDHNTHYYSIKVVAKDVNGRKCKRVINFKVSTN